MKKETRNLYEGMYIISATLTEEARRQVIEKITKGIADQGGEVKKMHEMGLKRLSYEIKGSKEGHYYLLYFELNPNALEGLWKDYHLNEDLIRFMTLRTEKILDSLTFKPLQEASRN